MSNVYPLNKQSRLDRFSSWYSDLADKMYSKEVAIVAASAAAAYLGARHGLKNMGVEVYLTAPNGEIYPVTSSTD